MNLYKPQLIAKDHYLLEIENHGSQSKPGQFINIKAHSGTDPLLRRPFSIFNHNENIIEVVIRLVGKGTRIISASEPGPIDSIGPFGKGFTLVKDKKVLLAGGGVGNAPLYYLASELLKNNWFSHHIHLTLSQQRNHKLLQVFFIFWIFSQMAQMTKRKEHHV